ncbi:MAG: polyamine ABC transporter substrate-binding protein [Hyphomicrobium sp.]
MTKVTRRTALSLVGGAALTMPFVRPSIADDKKLNIYNWADYIGETTIADFEKATGIKVVYDTYSTSEEMEAKMLAGKSGYDVANMSGNSMARFIKAGIFDKLDRSKLSSWGNQDPTILKILENWDPGNLHAMPYMWGTTGMTYNVDMVKERIPDADLESMDLVFKPENAAKLADCGISMLDSQQDIFRMALKYLGIDPETQDASQYEKVVELYKPIRKYIKTFDSTNYLNAIPNKELCVINNWSGDYATARTRAEEAGVKLNLAYFVPKTGAPAWVDCMSIPSDAKHKDNAHKFLEYLLQPEVVAKCTNFINYANANLKSKEFVNPEILSNPAIYPTEETMKRIWAPKGLTEAQDKAITRAFLKLKSG